ncbi:MAG: lactate utilization protein [Thermotogae bacterium]|nr:lactate utilization protein [Thermotogota bacterium]
MNEIKKRYYEILAKRLISNLKPHNIEGYYFENGNEAREFIISQIPRQSVVGIGGSTTVKEIGLLDALRQGYPNLYDQYEEGISLEESLKLRKASLMADYYVTGTNAITVDGAIVNIDGYGNRVAAMIFGPKKVFIVMGVNKICFTLQQALERAKNVAAVINNLRLKTSNPCVKIAECTDCDDVESICNVTTIINRQPSKGRMKVVLINEHLGF